MTTAQFVETSVTVNNTPIQDCVQQDDHPQPNYEMTPRIKPFTVLLSVLDRDFFFIVLGSHLNIPVNHVVFPLSAIL